MSKYVIVGGVAGGATTAARLRRLDEKAEIIIFERGQNISYANCGLPYYIGGVITDRDKLLVQTPESFKNFLNVDVRVTNEVLKINRKEKSVEVKNLKTGEVYTETYDKLVVSPGAEPVKPPIPGINDEKIFTLRNVKDTDILKEYIDKNSPKHAVVVGAGFIGLEMAENFHHKGIPVTIVEMAEQVMTPLDYEMAAEVHQHLKTKNVEFYLNDGVASFERSNDNLTVKLKSGKNIPADIVILSIGVRPENKLIKEAGLKIGEKGGICVNEYLQTDDENIYAVGDAIEFTNPITKRKENTYLAGPANKQGRIAADNIVNNNVRTYKGSISTAIAKVFDITVASCGVSEKTLKKENIPYISSITHGSSHAGYYPDALPMTLKIVFSPDNGKLLGAQIVGYEGVDKRVDLLATVLKNGGDIYDLQEIEHAYAPPYSSAKDPVNIAGFTAENILTERVNIIRWDELLKTHTPNIFLLDVRTEEEFALGTIDNSANISVYELRERLNEIPKDKKIILFCGVGLRGYFAARILMQNGFNDVYNLSGGYKTFEHATQKQSNEDIFENDFIGKDDLIYQFNPEKEVKPVDMKTIEVDACGLQCPGPIIKLKKEIDNLEYGERLREIATDPGFQKDVQSWCNMTGNRIISIAQDKGKTIAVIEKVKPLDNQNVVTKKADNKTMVIFSDDFDRAIASLIIANGAAAAGKKVTLFFTFWGLNVIKKANKPSVKKDFFGKMFGMMMPSHSKKLKLSKMNMMGIGKIMMRQRMKSLNVDSFESLLQTAIDNGVDMLACQMSMDVMGVKKEELLDNVEVAGVASYLEEAENSNMNLFI
jgi:NADPH-dependent 2,4-dienoyl-CoA reductase/sulfur reductase-like enzyme/peroxiredoxin family protein/rhodanese-related sulfurtransferase/TusA-related sulfurtransferase